MTSDHDFQDRSLDELLGLDPEPRFAPEAQARLLRRLRDARVEAALDADVVVTPVGLPARVLRRVRGGSAPAEHERRAPRPRRLALVPLGAAAAALAIWTFLGRQDTNEQGRDGRDPIVAVSDANEPVSDELLASLTVLENLEFLTEELDPLEADALFLLSMDDQVLLDLFDAELADAEEDD